MEFDSQRWIRHIKEPILILHAMDDATIPYELGDDLHLCYACLPEIVEQGFSFLSANELYQESRRLSERTELVTYGPELGWGHNNIFLDPDLPETLLHFIEAA